MQAALASAISFACGAGLPVLVAVLAPMGFMIAAIGLLSLAALALLGAIAAQVGGARVIVGVMRVMVLGVLAMALTLGIGAIVGRFDP
jgi:VIT1/CCC1 family predicted Fe2+/Mn2+ transporter